MIDQMLYYYYENYFHLPDTLKESQGPPGGDQATLRATGLEKSAVETALEIIG